MIWLIYGIMCIPYVRVYAMFWHRNHVSLVYVSYYSLLHREWCDSIDTNGEYCIFMLTIPFALLYSITIVVISSILCVYANQRTPYSLHLSSASISLRILQAARWLAGKYRVYKWGTARNRSLHLSSAPIATRLFLLNMAQLHLNLNPSKVQKVNI